MKPAPVILQHDSKVYTPVSRKSLPYFDIFSTYISFSTYIAKKKFFLFSVNISEYFSQYQFRHQCNGKFKNVHLYET